MRATCLGVLFYNTHSQVTGWNHFLQDGRSIILNILMISFSLPGINPGQYVLPWPTIASGAGGTCGESELLLHGEFCNVSGTRPLDCGLDLEIEKGGPFPGDIHSL